MSVAVIGRPGVHARPLHEWAGLHRGEIAHRLDWNVIGSSPAILKATYVRARMVVDLTCQETRGRRPGAGKRERPSVVPKASATTARRRAL